MKNLKLIVIALSVLIALLLGGCESHAKTVYKSAVLGVKLGYECIKASKTEQECIDMLNSKIVDAL